MGMRKKLHAFFGRGSTTSKLRSNTDLAISRLSVLKKLREARCSIARSDVVQLLKLGNHDSALLRVEQVIKEQNMLDVFAMIEAYCHMLTERINLIEQEKVCPDELKEALSSLAYAASRCGEFPELQEIRVILTLQFGKEFVANAVELCSGCKVNPKIVEKLSTRVPSFENKMKVLKQIALEHNIVLQTEKPASATIEENPGSDEEIQQNPYPMTPSGVDDHEENRPMQPVDIGRVEDFSDSVKARRKYRDVADAAQAAFESATYAAEAARAAVELSRSESTDCDDPSNVKLRAKIKPTKSKLYADEEKEEVVGLEDTRVELKFEKIHQIQDHSSKYSIERNIEQFEPNKDETESSLYSEDDNVAKTKMPFFKERQLGREIVFDGSDDEFAEGNSRPLSETYFMNIKDDTSEEGSRTPYYHSSQKNFPLRSVGAGLKMESGPEISKAHSAEAIKSRGALHLNIDKRPISVRTRRTYGP